MGLVEQQFETLKSKDRFANATLSVNSDGSYVVRIPDVPIPAGWNREKVSVYFIVPVGYPMAKPDCFWTDCGLMLAGDRPPQSTGDQSAPGLPPGLKWFSWHVQTWAPNHDTLQSYLGVILKRFEELR